ncbi:pyroglutamyl-peptidase I [Pseudoduganella sp. FT25W]|jgi:pyroglutamyl-peptidase|uniref:Pyrrolidone-carboxylate peptidase n=1 Tax=Duganella alba TaxID=2666081 RepID=A0A6L5QDI8_9BURK|nr:pyroglutamyl-peptidase I [Duganella alba]MRX07824.1 pyroglutamyl-peptidase I [Duganella alba]MRX15427.1 pyroglutamyl-peptidase I [Duganella alba]
MKKIILLTGFEPFNKETINPSWEAVQLLDGWHEGEFVVHARQLPCAFGKALKTIHRAVEELQPSIVISVGQAGGRVDLSVERVAINVDDAPYADNQQRQPVDQPIVNGGPAAYFSTLPIKAIVHELREAGLPASVSQSAGTFVCNHVFYGLMHQAHEWGTTMRAGFIHIPYLPQQAARHPGTASMKLEDVVEGLRIAVRTTLAHTVDVREAGGLTH